MQENKSGCFFLNTVYIEASISMPFGKCSSHAGSNVLCIVLSTFHTLYLCDLRLIIYHSSFIVVACLEERRLILHVEAK